MWYFISRFKFLLLFSLLHINNSLVAVDGPIKKITCGGFSVLVFIAPSRELVTWYEIK